MAPLFDPVLIQMLAFESPLSLGARQAKHSCIRKLTARVGAGLLTDLAETRTEQSFNERLFAEVFDYLTLLRDGVLDVYHLRPKGGAVVGAKRHYDDFSLGFFGPGVERRLVHAELKKHGTDLDHPQFSGSYGGRTPVQQAFDAVARTPTVEWVLVSNFDELRLYNRRSQTRCEKIVLSDIASHGDLQRAYALLGRPTLIGKAEQPSPLLRLLDGGPPMLLPSQPSGIRLIHEARAADGSEGSLPEMDSSFRDALAATNGWSWAGLYGDPAFVDDRLVVVNDRAAVLRARLEYTRNGVVRLQERLDTEEPSGQAPPVLISAETIAARMAMFMVTAGRMLAPFPGRKTVRWTLLDGNNLVVLNAPARGLRGGPAEISTKDFDPDIDAPKSASREHLSLYLTRAIRDLLFPWNSSLGPGKIQRLKWSDDESARQFGAIGI
ncbi:MAG: hypothetical protein IPJ61_21165 [Tessaracoccus sp.]|uniref:hypothetical protein n=1 Tax=Tessaracoccus sp. TaxID=1971211 RepID=UPI001EBA679C|nr:hypothetical protein [Tessaracoccus sp.]MBK7823499.1 hypothetical protein [Tessaracoccus sp.]